MLPLTWETERWSDFPCNPGGKETWVPSVPWVPVLTSDCEPSVLIDTSLWLLQPPWLESKTKLKTKANKSNKIMGAETQKADRCPLVLRTNCFMQRSNYQ